MFFCENRFLVGDENIDDNHVNELKVHFFQPFGAK